MKKSFYFLSILILFLFNSISVNAIETDFKALEVIGYNNNGNSLTMGEQFYCDMSNGNCSMYLTTLSNSYGGAWGIQSPIPLLENHTYSISLEMRSPNSGLTLSSKSNVSIGTTMDNARNNYVNSYFNTDILTSSVHNYIIQYAFKANTNANYLIIPFTTFENTYSIFYIDKLIIDDLGATSVSSSEINNILNNQTSILQSDINNINDNINDMENSINNNIKDNFNTCRDSYNLIDLSQFNTITNNGLTFTKTEDGVIVINGTLTATFGLSLTHVTLSPGEYSMASNSYENVYLFNYNTLTTFLESGQTKYLDISTTFGVDMYFADVGKVYDNVVIKPMLNIGSPKNFEPFGEICSNKIDQTNDKLNDLNDNITNSDSSGASGEASDFFSNFNTDTFGLTSVITAPLELIKSVTSKTCSSLELTLPFVNEELNLPCLSTIYESYFGSFLTIYRTITFGFVSYWVCIKIFNLVKDFKNPEHDEIEVLDL